MIIKPSMSQGQARRCHLGLRIHDDRFGIKLRAVGMLQKVKASREWWISRSSSTKGSDRGKMVIVQEMPLKQMWGTIF